MRARLPLLVLLCIASLGACTGESVTGPSRAEPSLTRPNSSTSTPPDTTTSGGTDGRGGTFAGSGG